MTRHLADLVDALEAEATDAGDPAPVVARALRKGSRSRSSRRTVLAVAATVAAVVALPVAVAAVDHRGRSAQSWSSGKPHHFEYGSPTTLGKLIPVKDRKAPKDFSAQLLSGGGTSSTAGAKGKVLLVNFWASWCGPCKAETPAFDALYRSIKGQGVDFLGIDTKDDRSDARDFVKVNQISYPIVYDQPGQALLTLGNFPSGLPFTLLLDKQGRVAAVYIARLTTADLTGPITTLLAEK